MPMPHLCAEGRFPSDREAFEGMRTVYATQDWGIHDDRWMAALRAVGFDPVAVSRRSALAADFRASVLQASDGTCPVLAGPLDSVTVDLLPIPLPIVGLSWGFDIPAMRDLTWLADLHGVIVDSEANQRAIEAAGVRRERITFLPWGVDLDVFTPEGPKLRPASVPMDACIVLSLRAHEPRYRVDTVIDAFARLAESSENMHLVIGHSGALTDELRSQVGLAGIDDRVHFIGTVPEADLPGLLRASDCYVSASEVDGTSVTLLQAMACGVPVAVSRIDGNRAWVEDGVTGHLFPVGQMRIASDAIRSALSENTIALAARRLVAERADWHANLARLRRALSAKD